MREPDFLERPEILHRGLSESGGPVRLPHCGVEHYFPEVHPGKVNFTTEKPWHQKLLGI